ncbi:MAG: SagB/ThcOx family dehydrogenase, partial [Gemmatimonadetes bacterium]|nr:SagB/ThcOx family dehydrogenase [Gemmatimonadota bacterium]
LRRTRRWERRDSLCAALEDRGGPSVVEARVRRLLEATLLESIGRPRHPGERAMAAWEGWNPAAGFFHSATRDQLYTGPPAEPSHGGLVSARTEPPVLKRMEGPRTPLPAYERDDELSATLRARRTWRRFGSGPIPHESLARLLGATWGVQAWVGDPPAALKTSPSGGAKHAHEAYVVARDVEGLGAGTYHYDPDRHELVGLDAPADVDPVPFLAGQAWFEGAAALVFMTCVFERIQYKYRFARAYRVALMEAGHLAQTFLLVATQLGLAPFCTAALADSAVEAHLGLDGVRETVLYAVGVGVRPDGVAWAPRPSPEEAPWPTEEALPRWRLPTHAGGSGPHGEEP